jgi:VanZ family protein
MLDRDEHYGLTQVGKEAPRPPKVPEKQRLGIFCGIVIVGVLICTLWPFDPFPSNQANWLRETNGIRFGNQGVVISHSPLIAGGPDATKSCSLELLIQPAEVERSYTIMSFYATDKSRLFRVRQWKDGLLVSRNVLDAHKVKREKFDVDHVFQRGRLVFLTLSSGLSGTVVYVNGRPEQVFHGFSISQSDLSGQIVMGTSAVSYDPWPGEIRGVAVYSKELTPTEVFRDYENWTASGGTTKDLEGAIARYSFKEREGHEIRDDVGSGPYLEIPRKFTIPYKPFLESPAKEVETNRTYTNDVLVNIVGFVPVGFLVCAYLGVTQSRKREILYSILLGGTLSFAIEVLQFYIPRRGSGTTDIITNTLGAAFGAVLARQNFVRMILHRMTVICWPKPALRLD